MRRLRLTPHKTDISFTRFRRISYPLSAVLSLISVLVFLSLGMHYGIDFAGGAQMELRARSGMAHLADVRARAQSLHLGMIEAQTVSTATDVVLRIPSQPAGEEAALRTLRKAFEKDYVLLSVEDVGPSVSGELVQSGILGVLVAIVCVWIYLWFRFEWQFAVGAIIATMHDLLLTIGFFACTRFEFNSTSIAAILTIIGYSLNETVIILDRIRETMRKYKKLSTAQIIDMSVNAVLPRTLMTATTVFLALLALLLLGGDVIRSFAATMLWGVCVATYSAIFIGSPILIYMGLRD